MAAFDQLKAMVIFAEIAKAGSFAQAARQLQLSRAVVSYHLKNLETQLGVALLHRTTRSLSLTEAGRIYLKSSQQIGEALEEARRRLETYQNEPTGTLKMTCSHHLGVKLVAPLLVKFRESYPRLQVDLLISDHSLDLVQHGIDLAIRGGVMKDSDYRAKKLVTFPTFLCASPGYLAKRGQPLSLESLAEHDWVVYSIGKPAVRLTHQGKSFEVPQRGSLKTNSAAARLTFTLAGCGLAKLPSYDAEAYLRTGELQRVLPRFQSDPLHIYGVTHNTKTKTLAVRLFMEQLEALLAVSEPAVSWVAGRTNP